MKESIAALSTDKRLQLILIAFCFGAFLEGTGGGGAPVAIAGSFLIGLGFEPFQAATLCLLANTAPVAWGASAPRSACWRASPAFPSRPSSAMTGRILPPLSAILPLWLVRSMVGWRETFEVWPALAVSGLSFAVTQFYWSNYQESGLVDIIAALVSLLAMVAFLKVWRPQDDRSGNRTNSPAARRRRSPSRRGTRSAAVLKGWSPFLLASVLIFLWACRQITRRLTFDVLKQPMPSLHRAVLADAAGRRRAHARGRDRRPESRWRCRARPSCSARVARGACPGHEPGADRPDASAGRCVQLATVAAGDQLHGRPGVRHAILGHGHGPRPEPDADRPRLSVLRHAARLAGRGPDRDRRRLERALRQPAEGHGRAAGLSPILMAAANSSGGVMGKMIDAQSIVVSSTATQQVGREAAIFKAVIKHSVALACLVGADRDVLSFVSPGSFPVAAHAQVHDSVSVPVRNFRRRLGPYTGGYRA